MTRHGRFAPTILVALAACSVAAVSDAPFRVADASVRALLPGQDKTVGYFAITNTGSEQATLVGAESDQVRAMEIHTTIRDGDVVRMRRLSEVVIPAGATIRFQPGGKHLMLFGVKSLEAQNEIRLLFEDGRSLSVEFRRIAIGEH